MPLRPPCGAVITHHRHFGAAHANPHQRVHRFDEFIDLMKAAAATSRYSTINFIADNSVDKEVARSISGDIYLIAISIGIFVVLAVTFLTR